MSPHGDVISGDTILPARPAPCRCRGTTLVYQVRLLGFAEILFADKRRELEYRRTYRLLAEACPWRDNRRPGRLPS